MKAEANKRKKVESESDSDSEENGFKADDKRGKTYAVLTRHYNTNAFTEKEEPKESPFSYTICLNHKSDKAKTNSNDKIQELEKIIVEKDKTIKDLNNKLIELNNIIENMKKDSNEKIRQQIAYNEQLISENENLLSKVNNLEKQIRELINQNKELAQKNYNKNNNVINNMSNNNINLLYKNDNIPNISNNNYNINQNIPNNNIKININPQKEKKEIFIEQNSKIIIENVLSNYREPTLIGLQNVGATCFMNSVLQCLSQTTKLTIYFLEQNHRERIINNNISLLYSDYSQLAPRYLELLENLWKKSSAKKYYAPYNFMNTVTNMNPLFKRGEAGDAKDFIIFVLEEIHKELKKPVNIKNNKMLQVSDQLNQYDKQNALYNFFNEFSRETSIISDLFFGFIETNTICLNCKNYFNSRNRPNPICYNYGIFNLIIFPLEEVKNMRNNQNLMNMNNFYQGPSNEVNIDDCFIYNQKTDYFTGENKNYCNICKQLSDSYYTSRIYSAPNILILILNRGKGNVYKVKMNFSEKIDITKYVIQNENKNIVYNLYGVITHIGESGPNAHFVASCRSPIDGKWYRYNDALVDPIKNFQKDIHDFNSPYILFYEKAD